MSAGPSAESSSTGSPNSTEAITENRHPNWVALALEWRNRKRAAADIHLTIIFATHRWESKVGWFEFGLTQGELALRITGGEIPLALREPKGTLPVSIKAKRGFSSSASAKETFEKQSGFALGIKEGKGEASATISSKRGSESARAGAQSLEFEDVIWTVWSKGSEVAPRWTFAPRPGDEVIRGSHPGMKLGQVKPNGDPCALEAEFSALPRHLRILEASNVFVDLTFEKAKVFRLLVARQWLGSYLSRAVLPLNAEGAK